MKKISKYSGGGMITPTRRYEFEHNIFLVLEDTIRKIDSGNQEIIQNVSWATVPHLKKVKRLPNGRINLLTINEQIRLQGNMFANMPNWPEPEPQF